ncbi:hypothetical protein TSAR_015875 [Trichomalopsis sarcophagae]|uniref:Uncharacterized protein n=1 Tax=Trichomalopsis sarcophagae TaxID=543379 RepID=A0A232EJQ9_9HYME|nr:hypothetical protein TSAR_015875 [Trichomalopsis sarcophagae]
MALTLRSQLIKENKLKQIKIIDYFLELREDNIAYDVNKTVEESQILRKYVLPSVEEIRRVALHIQGVRNESLAALKESYSDNDYRLLSESDIERITLDNLNTKYNITEESDPDLFKKLTTTSQETVSKYVRYSMRGKKGRLALRDSYLKIINKCTNLNYMYFITIKLNIVSIINTNLQHKEHST